MCESQDSWQRFRARLPGQAARRGHGRLARCAPSVRRKLVVPGANSSRRGVKQFLPNLAITPQGGVVAQAATSQGVVIPGSARFLGYRETTVFRCHSGVVFGREVGYGWPRIRQVARSGGFARHGGRIARSRCRVSGVRSGRKAGSCWPPAAIVRKSRRGSSGKPRVARLGGVLGG